jgi:hypothetical protein
MITGLDVFSFTSTLWIIPFIPSEGNEAQRPVGEKTMVGSGCLQSPAPGGSAQLHGGNCIPEHPGYT